MARDVATKGAEAQQVGIATRVWSRAGGYYSIIYVSYLMA